MLEVLAMVDRFPIPLVVSALALAAGLLTAVPARADAIDGNWCAGDGRSMTISGPAIVTPGGKKAVMAALDRDTGTTLWATPQIAKDSTGYASPLLLELAGRRQVVSYSTHHVFGVDAAKGTLLWKLPWPDKRPLIGPMAVLDGDAVLASGSSREGGMTMRIRLQPAGKGFKAERVWTAPVDNLHGGSVLLDGKLYLSGNRTHPDWACLDARTGKVLYKTKGRVKGAVIYADKRLYCLSQDGVMALLEPTDAAFRTHGSFRLVKPKRPDAWPHPVICDRRLYLRYHDTLYCYDIAAP